MKSADDFKLEKTLRVGSMEQRNNFVINIVIIKTTLRVVSNNEEIFF